VQPAPRATPSGRRAANRILIEVTHPRGSAHGAALAHLARRFLLQLEKSGVELSLSLVDDEAIHRLNREWRKKTRPTDVLSFPAGDPVPGTPGPHPLGDVVISLDTAARRVAEEGGTVRAELARYLAHGLLHLLGYDHHSRSDAAEMARQEARLLGSQGLVSPQLFAVDR
jgi:probable rRNA maturation factor